MEDRAEFDLAENIEIWASQLSKDQSITPNITIELKNHLLDEIEELQKLGLSNEEAFLVAKKRIGSIERLTTEYSKINTNVYFKNRIMPYLKGILLFVAFITTAELMTNLSVLIAEKFEMSNSSVNWLSIGLLMLLTAVTIGLGYSKYKNRKWNIGKVNSIPFLVITIVTSKLLIFLSYPLLTRSIKPVNFSTLSMTLNLYQLLFALLIMVISCLVFYSSRKDNRIALTD